MKKYIVLTFLLSSFALQADYFYNAGIIYFDKSRITSNNEPPVNSNPVNSPDDEPVITDTLIVSPLNSMVYDASSERLSFSYLAKYSSDFMGNPPGISADYTDVKSAQIINDTLTDTFSVYNLNVNNAFKIINNNPNVSLELYECDYTTCSPTQTGNDISSLSPSQSNYQLVVRGNIGESINLLIWNFSNAELIPHTVISTNSRIDMTTRTIAERSSMVSMFVNNLSVGQHYVSYVRLNDLINGRQYYTFLHFIPQ